MSNSKYKQAVPSKPNEQEFKDLLKKYGRHMEYCNWVCADNCECGYTRIQLQLNIWNSNIE
jgi:hypothetical protein